MQLRTGKLIAIFVFSFFVFSTACTIENLPTNANNSNVNNANLNSNLPKNSTNTNVEKSPAPNSNTARSANVPEPPDSNSNYPPYNSGAGNNQNPAEVISVSKLIIPVEGIKKENLLDTFNDARSEGRVHNALDIMAAGGTPVLAATDGKIVKFHDSNLGGITIYQESSDNPRLVLYYAHLQRRADNLAENTEVKKGTVIGYVGDTGNAGAGNYHLHFAMWIVDDPKRYWDGANVNPYDYLK
jgi:peptidoglycan LD-endopeptidase LytH